MAAPIVPAAPAAPAPAPAVAASTIDFRTLSADAQRAALRVEDIWTVNKVYFVGSNIMCSVVHGPSKVEVVGVPLCEGVLGSFALHLSVLRGHVNAAERAILRQAAPTKHWRTVPESADIYRRLIQTDVEDEELIFLSKFLEGVKWPDGAAFMRSALAGDQQALRRWLNQDGVPTSKVTCGAFWVWSALDYAAATYSRKVQSWASASAATGEPTPIPVSEQVFRSLIQAATPSTKLSVPLPIAPPPGPPQPPPAAPAPSLALSPALQPAAPLIPAPGPRAHPAAPFVPVPQAQVPQPPVDCFEAALALGSTLAAEMDLLADVCSDIPPESVTKVTRNLHLRLSTVPACTPLLPLINVIKDPAQIAVMVSAHAPYFGADVASVIHNLQQWRRWLVVDNVLTATDTLRAKHSIAAREAISRLPDSTAWGDAGIKIACRIEAADVVQRGRLMNATSRDALWSAILAIMIQTSSIELLKTVVLVIESISISPQLPAWAASLTTPFIHPASLAIPVHQPATSTALVPSPSFLTPGVQPAMTNVEFSGVKGFDFSEVLAGVRAMFDHDGGIEPSAVSTGFWFGQLPTASWSHVLGSDSRVLCSTSTGKWFVIKSQKADGSKVKSYEDYVLSSGRYHPYQTPVRPQPTFLEYQDPGPQYDSDQWDPQWPPQSVSRQESYGQDAQAMHRDQQDDNLEYYSPVVPPQYSSQSGSEQSSHFSAPPPPEFPPPSPRPPQPQPPAPQQSWRPESQIPRGPHPADQQPVRGQRQAQSDQPLHWDLPPAARSWTAHPAASGAEYPMPVGHPPHHYIVPAPAPSRRPVQSPPPPEQESGFVGPTASWVRPPLPEDPADLSRKRGKPDGHDKGRKGEDKRGKGKGKGKGKSKGQDPRQEQRHQPAGKGTSGVSANASGVPGHRVDQA